MSKHWIVGIDGSNDSRSALAWAATQAAQTGGRLTPICAWHVPLALALMSGRRAVDVDRLGLAAEAELVASETIESIGDPAARATIDEPVVVEGHPAPILRERSGPDSIVVVGQRGIGELKRRLLGSVSQYLATHSNGPVVVVPVDSPASDLTRIAVGFDGSDHAQAALRWALDVAPVDATVMALIAIDIIPWLHPELVEERYPDLVVDAQKRILAAAGDIDPDHVAEREMVLHGPRQAFAETFSDADLIVVGPRGIGGVARAILGSVTAWLLHDAPCPIAVVPSV